MEYEEYEMSWLELKAGYGAGTVAVSVTAPSYFSPELYRCAHYADYWAMASNGTTVSATLHVPAAQAKQWVGKVVEPFLYWDRLKFEKIRLVESFHHGVRGSYKLVATI